MPQACARKRAEEYDGNHRSSAIQQVRLAGCRVDQHGEYLRAGGIPALGESSCDSPNVPPPPPIQALVSGGAALQLSPHLVAIHFTIANIYASMVSPVMPCLSVCL